MGGAEKKEYTREERGQTREREREMSAPEVERRSNRSPRLFVKTKTLVDSGADVCLDVSFEGPKRFLGSKLTRSARENGLARVGTRREPSKS